MKGATKKPATMEPPPPGAHEGERQHGLGLGLLVGVLVGLLVVAVTLFVFELQKKSATNTDVVSTVPQPAIESTDSPRPTVIPEQPSAPEVSLPLEIEVTSPVAGATEVPIDAQIVLTFTASVDPDTVTTESVSVFDTTNNQNLSSLMRYNYRADSRQLEISFATAGNTFESGATIEVLVSTAVTDIAGTPLTTPFTLTFTTLP